MEATLLHTVKTSQPPATISVINSSETRQNTTVSQTFLVGLYAHQAATQTRHGALQTLTLTQHDTQPSLTLGQTEYTPAILDIAPSTTRTTHVAAANGSLFTATLSAGTISAAAVTPEHTSSLALSLSKRPSSIASSYSNGTVQHHEITPSGLCHSFTHQAHSLEAWIAHISAHDRRLIFSGSDDGALCATDISCAKTAWRIRDAHSTLGVTAILCTETGLWTGGYDDTLRIWDVRNLKQARKIIPMGSPVWRIQLNSDGDALIPGMQGGFKIVRGEEIVCSFGDGLAYAATWAEQFGKDIVVTGRFYDMEISAWRIERS